MGAGSSPQYNLLSAWSPFLFVFSLSTFYWVLSDNDKLDYSRQSLFKDPDYLVQLYLYCRGPLTKQSANIELYHESWHWMLNIFVRTHISQHIAQQEIRWRNNRSGAEAFEQRMSSSTTLLPSSAASSEAGSIRDCYLYNPDNSEQKQAQILIASAESKVCKQYTFCHLIKAYFVRWRLLL